MSRSLAAGERFGRYVLEQQLGSGAMGEVWRARHDLWSEPVALKRIRVDDAALPRQRWFRTEVRAVARLDHPNVVRVLDLGPADAEAPWFVMELAGGALDAERLAWPEARALLFQLLDGLAHAHARGVTHRDLKPGNVLLGRDGAWKLADFGIADLGRSEGAPPGRASTGTPLYMAPEQIDGRWRDHGPWTDLYALGCMAWELLRGDHPLRGRPDGDILKFKLGQDLPRLPATEGVPPRVAEWLARLTARDLEDRFERAADAARALEELDGARPTPLVASARPVLPGSGLALVGLRALQLVGRRAEQARLEAELAAVVRDRTVRTVLLRGVPGIGKSALARWICQEAHARGDASIAWATHGEQDGPHDGLAAMVVRDARCDGLDAPGIERRLSTKVPAHLAQALAALGDPDGASIRLEGAAERFAAIRGWLAHEARRRPLVVWLDDAPQSRETVGFLRWIRQTAPLPVLFVLTSRDDALDGQPPLEVDATIALGPLDADARLRLVRQLLRLDPRLAVELEERSGGNPLFALQVVGDWVERGALVASPDGYVLAEGAPRGLPESLRGVWDARLDAIAGVADPAPLELAAALGLQVDEREWNRACVEAGAPLADDGAALVEALVGVGLARRERFGWSWAHAMARESVAGRAEAAGRWKERHAACARVLTASPASRRARHLVEAGALEEALEPLLEDGISLGQAGRHREGIARLSLREDVLDRLGADVADPRRLDGWTATARLRFSLGEGPAAQELAARAHEVAAGAGHARQEADAALALGVTERAAARPERTRALAERALALFRSLGDEIGVLRAESILVDVEPDPRAAVERAQAVLASLPKERAGTALHAALWTRLANTHTVLGQVREAEAAYREALAIYARLGNRYMIAQLEGGLAGALARQGRVEEARLYGTRCHERMVALEHPRGIALAEGGLASFAVLERDFVSGERWARAAIGRLVAAGSRNRTAPFHLLALALAGQDRVAEARDVLARLGRVPSAELEDQAGEALLHVACAHDDAEAREHLAIARQRFAQLSAEHPEPHWVVALEVALRQASRAGWDVAGELQASLDDLSEEPGDDDTYDLD